MKKIEQFQITSMSISGFKSYEKPTELTFGNPTVITGGNGRGKTSIADAIAFAVTGPTMRKILTSLSRCALWMRMGSSMN